MRASHPVPPARLRAGGDGETGLTARSGTPFTADQTAANRIARLECSGVSASFTDSLQRANESLPNRGVSCGPERGVEESCLRRKIYPHVRPDHSSDRPVRDTRLAS